MNYMFNDECTLLHIAALNGCLDIVKYLIEQKRVEVNQADKESCTALHWAARNGYSKIVNALIASEAKVKALDTDKKHH